MKRFRRTIIISLLSIISTISLHVLSALAVDPDAFTARLQKSVSQNCWRVMSFAKGCWSITASKSELDRDNIVLHDVVIKMLKVDDIGATVDDKSPSDKPKDETGSATPDEGKSILKGSPLLEFEKIDNITFENVSEDQSGNFLTRKLSIPMLKYEAPESKLIVTDITFENIKLASEKNKDPVIANFPYERASFKQINWTQDDNTIILYFDTLQLHYIPQPQTKAIEFEASAKSFDYALSTLVYSPNSERLRLLGYKNLSGSFDFHANWDIVSGNYNGDQNEIKLDDIGNLKFSVILGGINEDMVKDINFIQTEANTLAMFTVFDRISDRLEFGDINIRYDDRGFVNKVLDYNAENSGMTRETLRTQIKSTLPLMGTKIKDPEFVQNTSEQLGNFLDNPVSLTISMSPGITIPADLIEAMGEKSAIKLINLLKLKLEVNK